MAVSVIEYALMAGAAYDLARPDQNEIPFPSSYGWSLSSHVQGSDGFEAVIFQNENNIVISFAGTDDYEDYLSDAGLALGLMSGQLLQAAECYAQVKANAPEGAVISFTGHSLGGGLAALLGVFFDCAAQTFDQGPFALAASSLNADLIQTYLLNNGFSEDEKLSEIAAGWPLGDVSAIISARAAANISDIGVAGEVLRADFAALNILGGTVDIEHGGMEQASGDLHSMALLIALQRSDPLRLASISLPYIIENFFNGDLFASDPSEAAPDFLSNLIRYEFGTQDASGEGEAGTKLSLLSKFGNDASTLSQFFGAGEEITRPVYEIMMSYYHERLAPVVPPALVPEEFFSAFSGGIQFDTTLITQASVPMANAHTWLIAWLMNAGGSAVSSSIAGFMTGLHRITLGLSAYINAGTGADSKEDFMLSGSESGSLQAGGGNDLLVGRGGADQLDGGDGADTLYGGGGNDILIGGDGNDTYILAAGDGTDSIYDSNGADVILRDGSSLTGTYRQVAAGSNIYSQFDSQGVAFGPQLVRDQNPGASDYTLFVDFGGGDALNIMNWSASRNFGLVLNDAEAPASPNLGSTYVVGTGLDSNGYRVPIAATPTQSLVYDAALYYPDPLNGQPPPMKGNSYYFAGGGQNDLLIGSVWIRNGIWLPYNLAVDFEIAEKIQGMAGDDRIYGEALSDIDSLDPLKGDTDVLVGGKGSDLLFGGAGDDLLLGRDEVHSDLVVEMVDDAPVLENFGDRDYIDGGAGDDFLAAGSYADTLLGGAGDDWLLGGAGSDTLSGGTGEDIILGDSFIYFDVEAEWEDPAHPWIFTANFINSGSEGYSANLVYNDLIDGGDGSDQIYGEIGDDVVLGGAGNDILLGDRINEWRFYNNLAEDKYHTLDADLHGNDTLYGGSGNDDVFGNGGDDLLDGGDGDDWLFGDDPVVDGVFQGNDTIFGGSGNDNIVGGGGDDSLDGGSGADFIYGDDSRWLTYDWLPVQSPNGAYLAPQYYGRDVINGGGGADIIDGGGGSDLVHGGEGNDVIFGDGSGDISAFGIEEYDLDTQYHGADTLYGDAGDDTIYAGSGDDIISGGTGSDLLYGGSGYNTYRFSQGDGHDQIVGFLGHIELSASFSVLDTDYFTTIYYGNAGDTILLLSTAYASTTISVNGHLQKGDGLLQGDASSNNLRGHSGSGTLVGGKGNDYLDGGAGMDSYLFAAGDGKDQVVDSGGLAVDITAADITRILQSATDTTIYYASSDTITLSNETFARAYIRKDGFSSSIGALIESSTANLYGSGNDDHIETRGNAPVVFGGLGNDSLVAQHAGTVYGQAGDDTLVAGDNDVLLAGGIGDDVYRLTSTGDAVRIQDGGDAADLNRIEIDVPGNPADFDYVRFGNALYVGAAGAAATGNYYFQIADYFLPSFDSRFVIETTASSFLLMPDNVDWKFGGSAGGDFIRGDNRPNTIRTLEGDDTVYGAGGYDSLFGGAGDDYLIADWDGGYLNGGLGDDVLNGLDGPNIYHFAKGDGRDLIVDDLGFPWAEVDDPAVDVVELAADILREDVTFTRRLGDLVIKTGPQDEVVVANYFAYHFGVGRHHAIEQIHFLSDNSVWTPADVMAVLVQDGQMVAGTYELVGSEGDDYFIAYDGSHLIDAKGGNDHIAMNGIYQYEGPTELKIKFGRGYGEDLFRDTYGTNMSPTYSVIFSDTDIDRDSLSITMDGKLGLYINIKGTTDTLHFDFFASYPFYHRDVTIKFADGQTLRVGEDYNYSHNAVLFDGKPVPIVLSDADDIFDIYQQLRVPLLFAGAGDDVVSSHNSYDDHSASTLYGQFGNDALFGTDQGDLLVGGEGDDLLDGYRPYEASFNGFNDEYLLLYPGESGNDTLAGGLGNDTLVGRGGDDLYMFSVGTGNDVIYDNGGAADRIRFDASVAADDVRLSRSGDDLLIGFGLSAITVKNYFGEGDDGKIEAIEFVGSTVWDRSYVESHLLIDPQGPGGSVSPWIGTGSIGRHELYSDGTSAGLNELADGTYATYQDDGQGARIERSVALNGDGIANFLLNGFNWRREWAFVDGSSSYKIWNFAGELVEESAKGASGYYETDFYVDGVRVRTTEGDAHGYTTIEYVGDIRVNAVWESFDSAEHGTWVFDTNGNLLQITGFGNNDDSSWVEFYEGSEVDYVSYRWQMPSTDAYTNSWASAAGFLNIYRWPTDGLYGADWWVDGDTIDIQAGVGTAAGEILTGSDEVAWILFGEAGDDTILAGAGSDILVGGSGNDSLTGGDGDDIYYFRTGFGQDIIDNSDIYGELNQDWIYFGDETEASDLVFSRDGDDLLIVAGLDRITVKNHFLEPGAPGNLLHAIDGIRFSDNSILSATDIESLLAIPPVVFNGGSGDDSRTGGPGHDSLYGGGGNDTLEGGAGDDLLDGGSGADTLIGGDGNDTLSFSSAGGDVLAILDAGDGSGWGLHGDAEGDVLLGIENIIGSGFSDELYGSAGVNLLNGGAGDDGLEGMGGADILIGGDGEDLAFYRNSGAGVTVDLVAGTGIGGDAEGDLLVGIEHLYGSDFDDTLIGTSASNTIVGFDGDDVIFGGGGIDYLMGNSGNDTISYEGSSDGVAVALQWNGVLDDGRGFHGESEDFLEGFENIRGTDHDDLFYGSETANTLWGGAGSDTLAALDGADVLIGGLGADVLLGGNGSDLYWMSRGDGQDLLYEDDASLTDNIDRLHFGADVDVDQVWFRHVGNDLEVSIIGTSDSTTILDWYSGAANRVEQFRTSDGEVLLDSQVETLVSAMAAFSPPGAGQTTLPPAYQSTLATVIAANWQ